MPTIRIQDKLASIIGFGSFFTTIFVAAWWTIEPVNAPKMVALLASSGAVLGIILANGFFIKSYEKKLLIPVLIFVLLSAATLILSRDPWETNFYGVAGRNTGFLTYFGLVAIFLGSILLTNLNSINTVLKYFVIAGMFNVAYCFLSILGIELLPWENIYNTILGTFGNPNFIGAFLGIFGVVTFAFIVASLGEPRKWIPTSLVFVVTFIEIERSNAIQGLVILGLGISFVAWFKLRSITQSKTAEIFYLIFVFAVGITSILGALQIGPLAKYIYKTSVSLRGEYWQAAWNMGLQNPLTGVGMDSYGSWYRRARDLEALKLPGVDTTTNAAHNVYLDLLAYGGFPLLIAYLLILIYIARSAIRILFTHRKFDFIAVSIVAAWICYLAQALISINQIGIAIWGWVFGGLIVAYDKFKQEQDELNNQRVEKKSPGRNTVINSRSEAAISLSMTIGLVTMALISVPPALSDAKWKSALASGDGKQLEQAAVNWPQDPVRLNQAIKIFSDNKWNDTSKKLSEISINKFSESYISWFSYLQLQTISDSERTRAKSELHRLDPNNPAWK
jgi:O-antigen ligase